MTYLLLTRDWSSWKLQIHFICLYVYLRISSYFLQGSVHDRDEEDCVSVTSVS